MSLDATCQVQPADPAVPLAPPSDCTPCVGVAKGCYYTYTCDWNCTSWGAVTLVSKTCATTAPGPINVWTKISNLSPGCRYRLITLGPSCGGTGPSTPNSCVVDPNGCSIVGIWDIYCPFSLPYPNPYGNHAGYITIDETGHYVVTPDDPAAPWAFSTWDIEGFMCFGQSGAAFYIYVSDRYGNSNGAIFPIEGTGGPGGNCFDYGGIYYRTLVKRT